MAPTTIARRMWQVLEPYHAVVYFDADALEAIAASGLRGFWRGYFATRAAPLGVVGADVVTAVFYNFRPAMVARAIPEVWTLVSPEEAWRARLDGADRALRRLLGGACEGDDIRRAATIARTAATAGDVAGRPLFAAYRGLDWPSAPHLVLWHAATLLREHRGDGHNAALVAAGIGGCEAHVMAAAAGEIGRLQTQPNRGWSDDDWLAAEAGLAARGLLDGGALTDEGRAVWHDVEVRTDAASTGPWEVVSDDDQRFLLDTLGVTAAAIFDAGAVRADNPIGIRPPA